MKKWFMAMALLFCMSAAHAQAEYPDVPLGDPAYADIKILGWDETDFSCYPPPTGSSRGMTRYEFAVFIARWLSAKTNQRANKFGIKESQLPVTPQQGAALQRLSKEFQPEIQSLGVPSFIIEARQVVNTAKNPQQSETRFFVRPTATVPQFPDVPKNHWAFSAVEKLRQSGVLLAYPNGAGIESKK